MSITTWFKSLFTKKDNKKTADYVSRAKVSAPKPQTVVTPTKSVAKPVQQAKSKQAKSSLHTSSFSTSKPIVREEHFFSDNGNNVDLVDVIAMTTLINAVTADPVYAQETVVEQETQPEPEARETCKVSSVSYKVDVETNDVVEQTTYTCDRGDDNTYDSGGSTDSGSDDSSNSD